MGCPSGPISGGEEELEEVVGSMGGLLDDEGAGIPATGASLSVSCDEFSSPLRAFLFRGFLIWEETGGGMAEWGGGG